MGLKGALLIAGSRLAGSQVPSCVQGGPGDCPGVSPRRAPSGVSLSLVEAVKSAVKG